MKPGSNRRPRSRPNNNNSNNNNNNNNNNKRQGGRNSYDSNGPDGKVRGTGQQVLEKYQALGRDATSAGDRVAAEAYFQFAEHYYRLVNADGAPPQPRKDQRSEHDDHFDSDVPENNAPEAHVEARVETQVKAEPVEPAPVVSEVITVPIMPGPIASPSSDDDADEKSAPPAAENSVKEVAPTVEAVSEEEKPKPVRRRRPRAKPAASKETDAEPAPV